MTPHEQQHLDELMDHFDFARVAHAMRALQWRWASAYNSIPNEPHIRATVRSYARQFIQQARINTGHQPGRGFIGTGGFHIEAFSEAGTLTGLYARFTLNEYSTIV
ncbi:hypothetical protein [Hymenobacter antarcticus]|uniref:DUF4054 domain-containing protein n=1 Tax=Hymenobacter antarcticus TaxID=486270 RepID=A0ABP7QRJ0_9BACT